MSKAQEEEKRPRLVGGAFFFRQNLIQSIRFPLPMLNWTLALMRSRVVTVSFAMGTLGIVGEARADDTREQEECCSRSVWVAPSYQFLLGEAFEPSSRHGAGAASTYEFHISERFNLGLNLAYRVYPGEQLIHQVGYGAILKHFFSDEWARQDGVFPFVDYGLLLQQIFIEGRRGNAVSHDTRLGLGAVGRFHGVPFFVSVAGHYSRLTFFDRAGEWIPYVDAQVGWIHMF